MSTTYPIDEALPPLREALRTSRSVVLSAPPGAGKTTRVPLALLDEPWLRGRKLIMLEPRRLAAQRAAQFMAMQLGEEAGGTVGYRIRGDSRVSNQTRIEVVTEGVLTRLLQSDPALPGVALIVFDEFHERSIHADLGLALALDVQSHLRDDLRLLLMSATLDGLSLSRVLGDAPVLRSEGRQFPVETRYLHFQTEGPVEPRVAETVVNALGKDSGDILVFLPGQREIRRVETLLIDRGLPAGVRLHTLHGEVALGRQQEALAPPPAGFRKVILSTSIAETSLTIDGVRVVIDAGLARGPSFDPRRGMSGLVTMPVSRASADQRRGRAGRLQPGTCYRLWTEEQHALLPAFSSPEILVSDLAPLVLELARWGNPGGEGLRFIDPPPAAHLAQATTLLESLGALDAAGVITAHGRLMAALPVHPRLAHMIARAKERRICSLACDVAALLEERDILRGEQRVDIDLASRWRALKSGAGVERNTRARVLREAHRLRVLAGVRSEGGGEEQLGILLALAFPERIARRRDRESRRYQMAGGTGAVLPEWSLLAREEFLAVAEVDGVGTEARVFLAAPVDRADLVDVFKEQIEALDELFWNAAQEVVVARRVQRLGLLNIDEHSFRPDGEALLGVMLEGIRAMGLDVLPWSKEAVAFRNRSEWLRTRHLVSEDWPDLSGTHLLASLPGWLGPFLDNVSRRAHLASLDLAAILRARFSFQQLKELDRLAPGALTVPTGSRIRLDYASGDQPVLAVRLQEMFGQSETPAVGGGEVNVLLHLLSPAGRPLAVTQDLPSFWRNAYPEVRKQMRGRYPKHFWPEDPAEARPTKGTKGRRR